MENKKSYIITIVILVLLVLGLGGFIVYDKILLAKSVDQTKTMIDDVNIDLNSLYQVGDTLNKLDLAFNSSDSTYFGYIYNTKKLKASNFDNGAALYVTIRSDFVESNSIQYLIGGDVKAKFEKIFGKNLKYTASNVSAGGNYKIVYNTDSDTYAYIAPSTHDNYAPGYVSYNTKTKLEEDKIVVSRKVFYVEYSGSSGSSEITKATIFKDSKKQKVLGTVNLRNNILSEEEVISKYASSMNEYDFTFVLNKGNDYNLDLIELKR